MNATQKVEQLICEFNLPLELIGVDRQFDGKRLTVHYLSHDRIDFRKFVKALHRIYKIKVWMRKRNQCKMFIPKQFASIALQTGMNVR